MSKNSLKDYADFLNKNYRENFYNLYLSEIEGSLNKIPIYNINKEDLGKLVDCEIKFFAQLKDNKIIQELNEWNNSFKTEEVTFPENIGWQASHIISIFNNRKKMLNHFLSTFVTQLIDAIELNIQIDHFFSNQVNTLVNTIENLHKEKMKELNEKITSIDSLLNETESSSHIGHCELDYINGKVKCSEEFYRILGINLDFKIDLPFLQNLVSQENNFNPFLVENIQLYNEEKTNVHEFKLKRPDQKNIQLKSNEFPIVVENGNIVGSKIIIQDITDLKDVDDNLKDKEHLIDKILEYSPTLILIYDIEENKIVYINDAVHQLLGYSVKSILDLNINDAISTLFHSDDIELINNRIEGYANLIKNELEPIEFRMIDSTEEVHWFYSKTIVFNRKNNKVKQILINATDITSFKKLQEVIFLKEAQILQAQEIANIGSYEWDFTNDKVRATDEFYKIFDLDPEKELRIPNLINYWDTNDIKKYSISWFKSFSDNTTFEAEIKLKLKNNKIKYILKRGKTFLNQEGKPVKHIGTAIDITNFKNFEHDLLQMNEENLKIKENLEKAQTDLIKNNLKLEETIEKRTRELQLSQERYTSFINQIQIGMVRFEFKKIPFIDKNLPINFQIDLIREYIQIAEANTHMSRMFGYFYSEEIIGKQLTDLINFSDEKVKELLQKFIENGYKISELEICEYDYLGKRRHFRINLVGITEDEKILRGWGVIQDITAKREAQAALKDSEERYKILTEEIPNIVWTTLPNGNVTYFNQKYYDYTGATVEMSMDYNWSNLIHPDDIERTLKVWEENLKTGNRYEIEYRLRRFDGVYLWHMARGISLKDKTGKILYWLGILIDIDEQKKLTEQLKMRNEDLDNFTYTASHDLKAPVSNIEGLLSNLVSGMSEDCKKDNETNEILDMMKGSVNKFKSTLMDLIEVTKAQKGIEENFLDNEMTEILKATEEVLAAQIKDTGAIITSDFSKAPIIKFPTSSLRSIVYNIVSNSIKYRFPNRKPLINITTERFNNNYILLTIQDNGLGFKKEQVGKVFSQFKRFHVNIEGSGVGLYIVKRTITNAGGKIELESEEGKGSVFKVYFKV